MGIGLEDCAYNCCSIVPTSDRTVWLSLLPAILQDIHSRVARTSQTTSAHRQSVIHCLSLYFLRPLPLPSSSKLRTRPSPTSRRTTSLTTFLRIRRLAMETLILTHPNKVSLIHIWFLRLYSVCSDATYQMTIRAVARQRSFAIHRDLRARSRSLALFPAWSSRSTEGITIAVVGTSRIGAPMADVLVPARIALHLCRIVSTEVRTTSAYGNVTTDDFTLILRTVLQHERSAEELYSADPRICSQET